MDFATWEPVYEAILADFGFERGADETARDRLASLLDADSVLAVADLSFAGETVAVAGAGPSLPEEVDRAARADGVVAASTAAETLRDANVAVDLVVTDLDKDGPSVAGYTRNGTPVAVHAHGDNVALLESHVPDADPARVLPTTQAAPAGSVVNPGGFTDGDRAAFLADALDAASLTFPGWDLDAASTPEKRRKLTWAERLLYWLEVRRGEPFDVLDGRRESIDTGPLPVE